MPLKGKLSISSLPRFSIALQLSVGCIIHSVLNEAKSLALQSTEISITREKKREKTERTFCRWMNEVVVMSRCASQLPIRTC